MATKKDIDVVNSRDLVAAFTGYLIQLDLEDRRNREVECQLLTTQAESLLNHNKYGVASRKYAEALTQLVGPRLRVPLEPTNGGGVVCPVYRKFTMKECLAAMTCCNGVARCLHETKEYFDALDWTVEVDVIHKNARFVAKPIFGKVHTLCSLRTPNATTLQCCRLGAVSPIAAMPRVPPSTPPWALHGLRRLPRAREHGLSSVLPERGQRLIDSLPSLTDKITLRREVLPRSVTSRSHNFVIPDPTTYRTLDVRLSELQYAARDGEKARAREYDILTHFRGRDTLAFSAVALYGSSLLPGAQAPCRSRGDYDSSTDARIILVMGGIFVLAIILVVVEALRKTSLQAKDAVPSPRQDPPPYPAHCSEGHYDTKEANTSQ
ncbi:hypothetical protein NUW54_g10807 [Trametes sanguinea]|uniref:Uncharacterized protein n=1 Tax=Trametes sanguinea TaxID=158606 RepID=A0ACC1NSC4_9APHY|nr:hypothetical protein NUW54_g10807 [Trametes sanguinea]